MILSGQAIGRNVYNGGSISFQSNNESDNEYAYMTSLPDGFGDGEFTLTVWVRPTVASFGNTASGANQRTLWSNTTATRYGAADWWFRGNFILDGHNNTNFYAGTFSLQCVASGRVRWLFGDGAAANDLTGDVWGIQNYSGDVIVDGAWHRIDCVRRWSGASDADLELWVDGTLQDTQTSSARTNMASTYWDSWTGYPSTPDQSGWFWGCEKQAALDTGGITQYEDMKGEIGPVLFWSRALSSSEIASTDRITGDETGLVGFYAFREQTGTTSIDSQGSGGAITLVDGPTAATVDWNTAKPF